MNKDLECSFCFKTRDEVQVLVKSTSKDNKIVAICDECVECVEKCKKTLYEPVGDLVS